jgi:hypothetical protein
MKMRWTGYVARMGEMTNPYRILEDKLEGKRSTGSLTHAGKEIDIKELEWDRLRRIHVA